MKPLRRITLDRGAAPFGGTHLVVYDDGTVIIEVIEPEGETLKIEFKGTVTRHPTPVPEPPKCICIPYEYANNMGCPVHGRLSGGV